jgi:phospholipase C
VLEGERFIGKVYSAIRANPDLWRTTAMLLVYDEHGGTYDHVPPPSLAVPDEFEAAADKTGTGMPFKFDRLGVRVPAVLISPWISSGTVINEVFEHASIPATVMEFALRSKADNGDQDALKAFSERSPREKAARTFLDALSLGTMRDDDDTPAFDNL